MMLLKLSTKLPIKSTKTASRKSAQLRHETAECLKGKNHHHRNGRFGRP